MKVLVVDDEEGIRLLMESELTRMGYAVFCVKSGEEALRTLRAQDFDAVLLDLKMPGLGGIEALRRMKESGVTAEVVILTGHPDVDTAIEAMKLGAYDYLTKPFKLAEVEEVLRKAAEKKRLLKQNIALKRLLDQREPPSLILGQSQAMRSLMQTIERIAVTDATVLIQGESGTGKELFAKAIHRRSLRAEHPFFVINCSAFQDQLLESELFGHEKGAFTGAAHLKQGLFEVADGGTVFLDEVGEMSQAMQAKLLRVLDSGELRRVGGTRNLRVDVRIIAATNKDLAKEVKAGRFREDLFFRLNIVVFTLPPLRERREDIPLLVEYFLERLRAGSSGARSISPEALKLLIDYPWPGNVRELENTIERLLILSEGEVIGPDDLPPYIRFPEEAFSKEQLAGLSLAEVERLHIMKVLSQTKGRKAPAARILGIDVKTLNRKIKAYRLSL